MFKRRNSYIVGISFSFCSLDILFPFSPGVRTHFYLVMDWPLELESASLIKSVVPW